MKIQDIFAKPIDRDIKGVIKVGQGEDENIKQELEEYVVTRELQKHFADFFSGYKRGIVGTTDKMGVWISGFFGRTNNRCLNIAFLYRYHRTFRKKCGEAPNDRSENCSKCQHPKTTAKISVRASA